ncbi:MAG: radical SAM family heme chaperone HemW [Oscillospiraceae bacterium]|nr:radical SAM family heme chaperone HemW [Oscillospiraceae bacterium]
MKNTGLYIHVPFCIKKCPYCDFYSVTSLDHDIFEKYSDAVVRNIEKYLYDNPQIFFDTVYFGGGTPSLLPVDNYRKIFSVILKACDPDKAEITAEINPKTADAAKLAQLRCLGMNRLSFGIQSACDSELKDLGRIHTFDEAAHAVEYACTAGFENISADIMIGLKGQTMQSLEHTIDAVTALDVKHISAYMLKIENGTAYDCEEMRNEVADEDTSADMYLLTCRDLEKKNIMQYEISNFAYKGYESRHNLKYWRCEDYIGIGPAAHSYFNGLRYNTPESLESFIDEEYQNRIISEEDPGGYVENVMLRLRLTEGYRVDLFPQMAQTLIDRSKRYIKAGLMKYENRTLRLTCEGFLVSNSIISDLI